MNIFHWTFSGKMLGSGIVAGLMVVSFPVSFADDSSGFDFKPQSWQIERPVLDEAFRQNASDHARIQAEENKATAAVSETLQLYLQAENFKGLESLLGTQNNLKVLPGGIYQSSYLKDNFLDIALVAFDGDTAKMESCLTKWAKAYPKSAQPHEALARFYLGIGNKIRGTGLQHQVPAENMQIFNASAAMAWDELDKAQKLDPQDPNIAVIRLSAARGLAKSPQELQGMFEKAVRANPEYLPLYERMARTVMPIWFGDSDDLYLYVAWASSAPHPGLEKYYVYASVSESLIKTHRMGFRTFANYQVSWWAIQHGYIQMARQHQLSTRRLQYFIWMALANGDKPTARILYDILGNQYYECDTCPFLTEDIKTNRQWAFAD